MDSNASTTMLWNRIVLKINGSDAQLWIRILRLCVIPRRSIRLGGMTELAAEETRHDFGGVEACAYGNVPYFFIGFLEERYGELDAAVHDFLIDGSADVLDKRIVQAAFRHGYEGGRHLVGQVGIGKVIGNVFQHGCDMGMARGHDVAGGSNVQRPGRDADRFRGRRMAVQDLVE
jgi:hypothetical protein